MQPVSVTIWFSSESAFIQYITRCSQCELYPFSIHNLWRQLSTQRNHQSHRNSAPFHVHYTVTESRLRSIDQWLSWQILAGDTQHLDGMISAVDLIKKSQNKTE